MARRSASMPVWDPDGQYRQPEAESPDPQPMMMPMPMAPQEQAAPEQMAMMGLQEAISGPPGPGWADDPAASSTMQGLGERSMGAPMETLRRVFQKQGRVY